MGKKVCILMQSNNYYSPFAGVSLVSLLDNNQHLENLDIYLLNDDIGKENKQKFNLLAQHYQRKLVFLKTEEIIKKLKELKVNQLRNAYTTYLKLFALDKLKDCYEKVLYLDADTVVVGKIDELVESNLNGYICGMANDLEPELRRRFNISEPEKWFNAGMILFNIKEWISQDCLKKIINYLKVNKQGHYFHEQDIINILFRNRIKRIDNKFNYMYVFGFIGMQGSKYIYKWSNSLFDAMQKASKDIRIYHCFSVFGKRPWHEDNAYTEKVKWDYYLSISPWNDYKKEKFRDGNITKIQTKLFYLLPRKWYCYLYQLAYKRQNNKVFKNNSFITASKGVRN